MVAAPVTLVTIIEDSESNVPISEFVFADPRQSVPHKN